MRTADTFARWRPVGLLALGMLLACGKKINPGADCPLLADADPVSYQDPNIQRILKGCGACHSSTARNRSGAPLDVNYDTYKSAYDNAQSGRQTIISGSMPPGGPLSLDDQCIFESWALANFPEKSD